ncbi:lysozyme inhibitor LprI family protein [Lysobacter sp. CA199]|uniref:lysozyme inhibitor LprI family protein n=1 Tax=Lysobacter sp. CA199 TaxID=3455608 RepID=UPI003F8D72EC
MSVRRNSIRRIRRRASALAAAFALASCALSAATQTAAPRAFDGFWEACQGYQGELWCSQLQLERHGDRIRGAWDWRASNTGGTDLFKGSVEGNRIAFDPDSCVVGPDQACDPRPRSEHPSYLLMCADRLHWVHDRAATCKTKIDAGRRYLRVAQDWVNPVEFAAFDFFKQESTDPAVAAAARKPSFDCAKAGSDAEHAICAQPALARADRAIASRYRRVRAALDPGAAQALQSDQRDFLSRRDAWFDRDGKDGRGGGDGLKDYLNARLVFLDRIDTRPREGLTGLWGDAANQASFKAVGEGRIEVDADGAEPVLGRWICEFDGSGKPVGAVLTIDGDDGSQLRFARDGGALEVQERFPERGDYKGRSAHCGYRGSLTGRYLPLK